MKDMIVIEVPAELKSFAEAVRAMVASVEEVRGQARGGRAYDYAEIERRFAKESATIERGAHEGALSALDVDARRVEVGGKLYRRVGRSNGSYRTMAGKVVVERTLYRACGCRTGKVVDAISLRVGCVGDGWLPGAACAIAHLAQQGTSREAEETSRRLHRLPYSRSSFERVPHLIGELYVGAGADIEDALIGAFEVPTEAKSISVSIDRVSIPMEEPRSRPRGRPRKNAPKRPIERNYRMAWCGTVTLHDSEGDAIHTIRYGRMPNGDQIALCEGLAGDVDALLHKRPDLDVVLLADGAHELWDLLEGNLDRESIGVEAHRLVDFWHVIEKLSPAAKVLFGDDASQELRRWRSALRTRSTAAASILEELEDSGCERSDDSGCPVHAAITYLRNHHARMNYAAARRRNLPIGSGNVEATCKSLVQTRMKRPGSRWKEQTGEHILTLRALALSDRWQPAVDMAVKPLRTSVRRAA